MKNAIAYVIIGFLLLLLIQRECTRNPSTPPGIPGDTVRITEYLPGDSIPYPVEIIRRVPYPVYIDCTVIVPADVDTLAILSDYYRKYYFDDTLLNDTGAFIRVMAHTFRNRLIYDSLLFQNRRKISVNTTIIHPAPPERLRVFAGIGTAIPSRTSFTANILIVGKSGYAIAGGYDLINRDFLFTGYIPLKFRRK